MKKWNIKEIKILKDNYKIIPINQLFILLPNRTYSAIQIKASELKLTWPTIEERFWKFVNKKNINECWNWLGACNKKGYGLIQIDKKTVRVNRYSWQLHFGKIPKDLCVLHKCDNPSCVNPNHLFLGTNQDNMNDMINKDRQILLRGEEHGMSKLTWNQVKEISILCIKGNLSQREIANMFNIVHSTVGTIHRNQTWKE